MEVVQPIRHPNKSASLPAFEIAKKLINVPKAVTIIPQQNALAEDLFMYSSSISSYYIKHKTLLNKTYIIKKSIP
ncbi:MAG: hypothetical protein GX663_05460 [Clostridiales bacterium]|nr:hypothetical protein [Clostridiales bacterium]